MRFRKSIFLSILFFWSIPVWAQVDTAWVRRYDSPGNGSDVATALAVDDSGNVYVTGSSATIKYLPNGYTAWVKISGVFSYALAVDDGGNAYVTGYSYDSLNYHDYATIKYAPNGDTLWVRRYNGPGDSTDVASAIAVDDRGNVYVTGSSYGSGTSYDYATIKYAPNGDTLGVRRYNGPGNADDVAEALAVDASGNVYVTGSSGFYPNYDYTTIKYVQFACVDTAGDANGDGNVTLPDIIYLVNRVFKGGPAPLKSLECCL